MRKRPDSCFVVTDPNRISAAPGAVECVLRACGGLLLYAGVAGFACGVFALPLGAAAVVTGAFAAVIAAVCAARRDQLALLPLAVALAAALLCAANFDTAKDGFLTLVNDLLQWRQSREALVYQGFAHSETSVVWASAPLCAVLGTALGALAALAPAGGFAVAALLGAGAIWSGSGGEWLLAALGGCAVLSFSGSGDKSAQRARLGGAALALAAAAAVTAGAVLLVSDSTPNTENAAAALRRAAHTLRYESGRQVLPEGDVRHAGAENRGDEETVRVTMSQPVSEYLRGYVGQRYNGDGWESADAEAMLAQWEVFYQFHREGLNGLSQLSALASLLEVETPTVEMQVTVLSGCRSGRLTPYELTGDSAALTAEQLRDTVPMSREYTGEKEYSFTATGNLTAQAYTLLSGLNDRWQEETFREYNSFEGYYREFVYDNYLTIPRETRDTLSDFLGDAPETITSYEAKRRVINCLDAALTYSETPESIDGETDLVTALLRDDPGGYDVHFATAAAVMLRYYGIPARYVEGYLITPDAVAGKSGETTLTLTEQDAHAWVEYYEDGVGWVPFEPTPEYRGVMEEPQWLWFEEDENADLTGSAGEDGEDGMAQTTRRTDVEELPQEEKSALETIGDAVYDYFSRLHLGAKGWAYIALWLVAAALLALTVRRAVICRRRQRLLEQPDDRAAAAAMCAYALKLAWRSGAPGGNVPLGRLRDGLQDWADGALDAEELLTVNDRALYGGETTPQLRGDAARLLESALEVFRSKGTVWQRLYRRWIRCLY